MDTSEITALYNSLVDGREITVVTRSGRTFTGVYDGEQTDPETYLYFETFNGMELKAEWHNVVSVSPRGGRLGVVGTGIMLPPEHPYAPPDGRRKPFTVRNPR